MSRAHAPGGGPARGNAQASLRDLITGHWVSQAIRVAAELGIADLLEHGPRSGDDLAEATGSHPRSLFRLLRALSCIGVFEQLDDDRFALGPMGECLRSDAADSLQAYALVFAGERHCQAWAELHHSVRTGETGYRHRFGSAFYGDLAGDAEAHDLFDRAMAGSIARTCGPVIEAYDFSPLATLVDVGGGDGTLLTAILGAHPSLRGVLFEREPVVGRARSTIAGAGLSPRCEVVAGDFFESLPVGADAYLMARCLRAFNDAACIPVLTIARRAMTDDGRLLVVERVVPPGGKPSDAKLGDLNMLVLTGGCERTEADYEGLLEAAGCELVRVVPTRSPMSVLEARHAH
ncbi:methyltransferase [soil metagenome]